MMPESTKHGARLALWIGLECTLNRVGETFHDQCSRNGHDDREGDIARFAEIRPERIRYPFLWEKAAVAEDVYDWRRFDRRVAELREHGLVPIAGLLHHGSGPQFTSLLDPDFATRFARYARAFAERYPWIEDYTPINEPLTTSRFSALYGAWHPHTRCDSDFARALLNQIDATRLAMQEIRKVNSRARLIQTEDLGRTTSTPSLRYQSCFENERRWLSFDLLCGTVTPQHPLWGYLVGAGLDTHALLMRSETPCPPDALGINHYLLSNRFLDHRLALYPDCYHGGNLFERYADLGAVDCEAAQSPPIESILWEAWRRYRIPMAVTETHLAGTREAQMRWLHEVWHAANSLRAQGVDLRAVTAWSLLGTYEWNSLCTRADGFYESGLFDSRAPSLRKTRLVDMARSLADDGTFEHPLLEEPGWWKTSRRIRFPLPNSKVPRTRRTCPASPSASPLLITGGGGALGQAFARICHERGIGFRLLSRAQLDITDAPTVRRLLDEIKPWAVLNAAGFVDVDRAEDEPERCLHINSHGPTVLAGACADRKIAFVTFSSDLVFEGARDIPYVESDSVGPLNAYGHSKAEAERLVSTIHPGALIVRTSAFFGPWDSANFIAKALHSLQAGKPVIAAHDVRISPTYLPDLVHACLDLLVDGEHGILHLANSGEPSWSEFARSAIAIAHERSIADLAHARPFIDARSSRDMPWRATRPLYSALASERVHILSHYECALERYFSHPETVAYLAQSPRPSKEKFA